MYFNLPLVCPSYIQSPCISATSISSLIMVHERVPEAGLDCLRLACTILIIWKFLLSFPLHFEECLSWCFNCRFSIAFSTIICHICNTLYSASQLGTKLVLLYSKFKKKLCKNKGTFCFNNCQRPELLENKEYNVSTFPKNCNNIMTQFSSIDNNSGLGPPSPEPRTLVGAVIWWLKQLTQV